MPSTHRARHARRSGPATGHPRPSHILCGEAADHGLDRHHQQHRRRADRRRRQQREHQAHNPAQIGDELQQPRDQPDLHCEGHAERQQRQGVGDDIVCADDKLRDEPAREAPARGVC